MHEVNQDVVVMYNLVKNFFDVYESFKSLSGFEGFWVFLKVLRVFYVFVFVFFIYSWKYQYFRNLSFSCKPRSDSESATWI